MVIKHAEEIKKYAAEQKFSVVEPNVRCWKKQKELLKEANSTRKAFRKTRHGNFNAADEKVLKFVFEKYKKRPSRYRRNDTKALEVATSLKIVQQDFKANNG